jgi:predicted neuraminidase
VPKGVGGCGDGGPTTVTDASVAAWNPVLAWSPRGRLTLFYKLGSPVSRWQTWQMTSHDDGHTRSQVVELVPGDRGGRGPVKNPPLALASGRWVAGASVEAAGPGEATATWDCFADVSDDDGNC